MENDVLEDTNVNSDSLSGNESLEEVVIIPCIVDIRAWALIMENPIDFGLDSVFED